MAYSFTENGSGFKERMFRLSAAVGVNVEKAVMQFSLTYHRALVAETPVMTGQAKANWQIDIGDVTDEFIGKFGFTTNEKALARKGESIDWSTYVDYAQSKIMYYKTGKILYIYNNLPYIVALNEGSSKQAPAQFVEAAGVQAHNILQEFNILAGVA